MNLDSGEGKSKVFSDKLRQGSEVARVALSNHFLSQKLSSGTREKFRLLVVRRGPKMQ
jgi:hypothetical protein